MFSMLLPMKHCKNYDQTILHATMLLVILYFGFLASNAGLNYVHAAYSQNQSSSFQAEVNVLDNMPAQKVKVGDIDIAYKQLGNNTDKPIVLINGLSTTMDMWSPTLLKELSSNRTVIIFDNRGAGESTAGTKEFSINQFANDTAGLLDALKIEKADILGSSNSILQYATNIGTILNTVQANGVFHTKGQGFIMT
jgi:hypothetical protein